MTLLDEALAAVGDREKLLGLWLASHHQIVLPNDSQGIHFDDKDGA